MLLEPAADERPSSEADHPAGKPPLFGWRQAAIGGGVALAAAALVSRHRARRAETANPPGGNVIEVDGLALHYLEKGEGPPILLLHGNGATAADWQASGVLDRLAETHRVPAFDRPGFGYTPRPNSRRWTPAAQARLYARALRALDVEPAIVVGHSWGVLPALSLALDHREAVSALVLMSGVYYPQFRADIVTSLPAALPLVGDVLCQTLTPLAAAATSPSQTRAIFEPAGIPERFADFPLALTFRPTQMRAQVHETVMLPIVTRHMAKRYHELDLPMVIVTGADDRIVDREAQSRRLNGEVRTSRYIELPGTGHMANYTALDRVIQVIEEIGREVRGEE